MNPGETCHLLLWLVKEYSGYTVYNWPYPPPPIFELPVLPPLVIESTMVEVTPNHVPDPPVVKKRRFLLHGPSVIDPIGFCYYERPEA